MAASTDEIDHLLELLEPIAALRARRMFGGWGIYAGDRMFAIVIDGELALKVDDGSRDRFVAAGSQPCTYRARGRELPMSYWRAPAAALDSAEAMQSWARLALEAAERTAARKGAKRPRKS